MSKRDDQPELFPGYDAARAKAEKQAREWRYLLAGAGEVALGERGAAMSGREYYYLRRRSAGACVRCGAASVPGRVLCSPCAKEQARADSEARAVLRAHRICQQCRNKETVQGNRYCQLCAGHRRDASRQRYASQRAAGRCTRCGEPASKALCTMCAAGRRERRKAVSR